MDHLTTPLVLLVIGSVVLIVASLALYWHYHGTRSVKTRKENSSEQVAFESHPAIITSPDTVSPEQIPIPEITDKSESKSEREGKETIAEESIAPDDYFDMPEGETEGLETNIADDTVVPESPPTFPPTKPKKGKPHPVNYGGRPIGSGKAEEKEKPDAPKKKRILKPEVVCWYEARKWQIGIETPEEFQEYIGLTVTQNGTPLTQDDKGQWVLICTDGKVSISWNEAEHPIDIDLNDKPYLLFRLAGQSISRGRLIHYATVGSFLVIAPDEWQRDEEASGIASILPEPVFIAGYQAHYFSLDRESDRKIAFRTPAGESVIVPARASHFELAGPQLPDASEDVGPLFGGSPPRIRALDKNAWGYVKTVVVGQEGAGRKRWRTYFSPNPNLIEQDLPTELSEKSGGWYFIRFYDAEDTLVESLDFRFVNTLKDIRISPHSALPGVNGHLPVRVEFLHESGCIIELATPSAENLSVEHEDRRTDATIPPDPSWDETRWKIHYEGRAHVEAKILVERVWWAVGEEGVEGMLNQWTDKPLNISRDFVTATSKHVLRFRLPRPRWAKEIRVGFEQWRARPYPVEVAKREVTVPLGDLGDIKEFEDRSQEHLLKLWIKDDASQDVSVVVAVIPATKLALIETGRARDDVRRMRNYLRRLGRRIQDSALRQMISETREKWSASGLRSEAGSYRIETSCVIALAWENLKANGIKPLGHRKRWLRRFVGLVTNHPDTMQEIREKYETLKHNPTNDSSRPKR